MTDAAARVARSVPTRPSATPTSELPSIIEAVVDRLVTANLATRKEIRGCTPTELAVLEQAAGLELPAAYRSFLLRMGHSAGDFLAGTDWSYPHLPRLRSSAVALMDECGGHFELAPTDFVFAAHQGYQFLYFSVTESADPGVYHFGEAGSPPRRVADRFTQWLTATVGEEGREEVGEEDRGAADQDSGGGDHPSSEFRAGELSHRDA
ncbi:MAG: SMI1/KNR4 family protein [Nocardioides sp.]